MDQSSRQVSPRTYICASSRLTDCIHLHTLRWSFTSSLLTELSSPIALNPHSSQAKLTAVDSPCPFRLFSRNDIVLTDALAEERKGGGGR